MSASSLSRCVLVCFLSTVFLFGGCQTLETGDSNTGSVKHSEPQEPSGKPKKVQETPLCKPRIITKTKVVYKAFEINQKLVIGAIEEVTLETLSLALEARIDTGATTSSLGATDIRPFERDGRQWVSFRLNGEQSDKNSLLVEREVARSVMIKRHGKKSQQRAVVKLKVRIGKIEQMAEFTLTDRSQFEYPMLVGRNILTDMAIVDVSHEFLVSRKKIANGKQL